ncbi:MAG: glycosyltransferase family 9 protein [Candidatus Omnitrophica bacterium]|nr:glycosyltransferase family 9 protein [Candidatus Omnitrophota bacterium]
MKKILVVNVNWLGDVVFSTPVFRALKEQYPQAQVSCLAVPRVADVLAHVPFIDEVIVYDEKGRDRFLFGKIKLIARLRAGHFDSAFLLHGSWTRALLVFFGKIKLIARLRAGHFDSAFLLHGSWTRALLVFLAGIPIRVGYDTKRRGGLLTHRVSAGEGAIHRSDFYLKVIEALGVPVNNRQTFLSVDEEASRLVQKILFDLRIKKGDFIVVMHVGGNWSLKQWPVENFAKLADALAQDFKAKVVICGGKNDVALSEQIVALSTCKPHILAGKTSFSELVALMKEASVVISADSGPLHIASSVGSSVIGLFGPTHPMVTGPRGSGTSHVIRYEVGCNAKPCYHLTCCDNICMKAIGVKDVVSKIREIKN